MSTDDSNTYLSEACASRAQTMLNNIPPSRFSLINPYPQYSQTQLDMRRKIEIFKYAGKDSQQTTSLTKSQQWSLLANNAARGTNRKNQYNCSADRLIPTPSNACNVPGSVVMFTYDPSIILFNYSSEINNRSYPDSDTVNK